MRHFFTKSLAAVSAILMLLTLFVFGGGKGSCFWVNETGEDAPASAASNLAIVEAEGEMLDLSLNAYADLLMNWWTGDATSGHLIATDNGLPSNRQGHLWEHAMAVFALDSLYKATGNEEIRDRIVSEWNFIRRSYPDYVVYVTVPEYFHTAQDDAGWNAMLYMMAYEYTGDTFALNAAGELIRNTYNFWKNGDLSNGLLYDHDPTDEYTRHASLHAVSTMLAAFDYLKYRTDEKLKEDTITLYNWVEETFLRDGAYEYVLANSGATKKGFCEDMLYWFNYNIGRTGATVYQGPDGAGAPNRMVEANSTVFLGGTMGMSVLHMQMYELTGEKMYRERALRTVRAIFDNQYLVKNGVLTDAGDGWTNAAFLNRFVTEVLTLPGVQEKDIEILNNTAKSIYNNARTTDGYYSASWSGPAEDANTPWGKMGWTHDKIMTTATSIHMIFGAGLAESLELPVQQTTEPAADCYATFEGTTDVADTNWSAIWQAALSIDSTKAHSGVNSLKASAAESWDSPQLNIYPIIKAGGAGDYTISMWRYSETACDNQIRIRGNGSALSFGNEASDCYITGSGTTIAANEWTQVSFTITVTEADIAADSANWALCPANSVSNYTMWLDDISVTKKLSQWETNTTFEGASDVSETNWSAIWQAQLSIDSTKAHSGVNSLKVSAAESWDSPQLNIYQVIKAGGAGDYTISMWRYSETAGDNQIRIRSNGAAMSFANETDGNYITGYNTAIAANKWTEVSFTISVTKADIAADSANWMLCPANSVANYTMWLDDISVIKVACTHDYTNPCDAYCMYCGEVTNPDAAHNVAHVEAVAPTCQALGNIEYWYCTACGAAWLDEAQTQVTNQMSVKLGYSDHVYVDGACQWCGEADPDAEVGTVVKTYTTGTVTFTVYEMADGSHKLVVSGTGTILSWSGMADYAATIKTLVIEDGLATIGYGVFKDLAALETVSLPDSLTNIQGAAFQNCSALKHIDLPEALNTLGYGAFQYAGLEEISLPASLTTMGAGVFYKCPNLTTVTFADGRTNFTIPKQSFSTCPNLTTINWGTRILGIGIYAFERCDSLTSVTVPGYVTTLLEGCFRYCPNLTDIVLEEGVKLLGAHSFLNGTNVKNVTLPSTLTVLGSWSFANNFALEEFTVPENVTKVGDRAFSYCNGLKKVNLPENVTEIAPRAFINCGALAEINMPASMTKIGVMSFYNCKSLTSLVIPEAMTTIDASAFAWCDRLATVYIDSATVAAGLNSTSAYGGLLGFAKTVAVRADITDVNAFVTDNYTVVGSTTVDGVEYVTYSK